MIKNLEFRLQASSPIGRDGLALEIQELQHKLGDLVITLRFGDRPTIELKGQLSQFVSGDLKESAEDWKYFWAPVVKVMDELISREDYNGLSIVELQQLAKLVRRAPGKVQTDSDGSANEA